MKEKKLFAITGGIGSGKSAALAALKDAGYSVLSSDEIVSELYEKRKVKKLIRRLFPDAVTGVINLKLDRKKISALVFNDKEQLEKLTALITPMVIEQIIKRFNKSDRSIFAEVPLLFERNYQDYFDEVIVVKRKLLDRVESVIRRSKLSKDEVLARINAQFDYDNSDLSKYIVISNDGDLNSLRSSVLEVTKNI